MARLSQVLLFSASLLGGAALHAAEAPSPLPTPDPVSSLEDRLRRMQELMNQMELQAEQTKSSLDKAKPQPISFGQGRLLLQQALYGPSFESASGAQLLLGFNLD